MARDGIAFASKAVVERLDPDDAAVVGIDPDTATTGPSQRSPAPTRRDATRAASR